MKTQDWYDLLGEYSNELCPNCNMKLLVNKKGDKWCSECAWSNDPEFTEFMKSLETTNKK